MVGVYELVSNGEVIYVGQSINVDRRIKEHSDKVFDAVNIHECEECELDSLEVSYIKKYLPVLNIRDNPNAPTRHIDKMKDPITMKIEREVYKKLQSLKLEMDEKSASAVIAKLIENQVSK